MEEQKRPNVGLGVIVLRENKVLLGKRKGSLGAGTWSFPGGHLEKFESFKQCITREMSEETGLSLGVNYKPIDYYPSAVTNNFFVEEFKHNVTLYFRVRYLQGEVQNLEPDKCEEWQWFEWKKFPNNLFIPVINLLEQGYNPFK